MPETRKALEEAVGRFSPDPEAPLRRMRERARRRRRGRRVGAALVGLAVFGATAIGFWVSIRLGAPSLPDQAPSTGPVASEASDPGSPTPSTTPPGPSPALADPECDHGPWFEECPEAVWATLVREEAGVRPVGNTDTGLLVEPDARAGIYLFWAIDPALHAGVQPVSEESLEAAGFDRVAGIEGIPVFSDRGRWAWSVHGLNVWAAVDARPAPTITELQRLVRASRSVPYDPEPMVCDLPALEPGFLPWLGSQEPVPEPVLYRSADGGGPQGLDPGYSMAMWDSSRGGPGDGANEGGLTLWRSTQSVGAIPPQPDVPPLPDGSLGRFYADSSSEGFGGAFIWVDVFPDTYDDPCSETTMVVDLPNLAPAEGREIMREIAESLVARG